MAEGNADRLLRWRERPSGRPVMYQTWTDLLFAHWEVPAALLQSTLPPGLTVETYEGRAYVGVVPFFMRGVRPAGVPPIPGFCNFLELNVRTYVQDARGNPGVWFYSLDCNQPFAVWFARALLGLPYQHARMKARRSEGEPILYETWRWRKPITSRFSYRIAGENTSAVPGSLEFFLVERYLLFTVHHDRLFRAQVHHQPYPLSTTELGEFAVEGFMPAGPDYRERPAHVIGSSGVQVEIFGAVPVS